MVILNCMFLFVPWSNGLKASMETSFRSQIPSSASTNRLLSDLNSVEVLEFRTTGQRKKVEQFCKPYSTKKEGSDGISLTRFTSMTPIDLCSHADMFLPVLWVDPNKSCFYSSWESCHFDVVANIVCNKFLK